MTWQSRNTKIQHVRLGISVIVVVLLGLTDMPIQSKTLLSQLLQTGEHFNWPIGDTTRSELEWDLTSIAAIDRNSIWVVGRIRRPEESVLNGGKGIVLTSADGGQTWEIRHLEPGKYFLNVHFINRNTGWVCDASDQILKTTDSGYTWTKFIAPTKAYWSDMQFVDSHRGWVLGADGKLLRTVDGGREWKLTQIATSGDLFFLDFVDNNYGWLVGEKGTAYETTDSGSHWRSIGDDLGGLIPDWSVSEIRFRMVKFVNSNVGFIAADVLSKYGAFSARAVVFRTIDRGRTWVPSIVPEALGIRSAAFLSEKQAWIVPGDRANTVIRHTDDGGVNWSSLPLPRNSRPMGLVFVDSNHGWFLNPSDNFNSDRFSRTKDGGKTWLEVKISERVAPS